MTVVCVDFGSTFTKAAVVDLASGELLATAEHRTTLETDVLDGWRECRARLVQAVPAAADAEVLACSSAGGGLRIAVVGNEALVTAEAGRRVALSSGGKVVHVGAGPLTAPSYDALVASAPDVVLLVGGTDGGNGEVLEGNAALLAAASWAGPVVVAGNVDSQPVVSGALGAAGTPYVLADNVVPRIGVLAPASARRAIREMFLSHVIGGKHLSAGPAFAAMVRGATPDVVLTAVDLLAADVGDVVVVDVGGATTDVYSVVEVDPEAGSVDAGGLAREVVATLPSSRSVEGDLGMRWSAPSTVDAALEAGFLDPADAAGARALAGARQHHPAYLPDGDASYAFDARLASWAVGVALRRHAGRAQVRYDAAGDDGAVSGRWVERSGVDLREVRLLVGSGGALRHATDPAAHLLDHVRGDGGWQVPEAPRVVVDVDYVLAPAGLLAAEHPEAARRLLGRLAGGQVR